MSTQGQSPTSQQCVEDAPVVLWQSWRATVNAGTQHSRQTWPGHHGRRAAAVHEDLGALDLLLADAFQIQQLKRAFNLRYAFLTHMQVIGSCRYMGMP